MQKAYLQEIYCALFGTGRSKLEGGQVSRCFELALTLIDAMKSVIFCVVTINYIFFFRGVFDLIVNCTPHENGFNVAYCDKEIAKKSGAQWDKEVKKWFAPNKEVVDSLKALLFREVNNADRDHQMSLVGKRPCSKCLEWVDNDEMQDSVICKCAVCKKCVVRCKTAAHVFFCEHFGQALLS